VFFLFKKKDKPAERLEPIEDDNPKGKTTYLCRSHADELADFMNGRSRFPYFYMTKNDDPSKKCDMCKAFGLENEALWTAHNLTVRLVE
jgi:hypothetical protein